MLRRPDSGENEPVTMNRHARTSVITCCLALLSGCSTAALEEQLHSQSLQLDSLQSLCDQLRDDVATTTTQLNDDLQRLAQLESNGTTLQRSLESAESEVDKLWSSDQQVRNEISELRQVDLAQLTGDVSTLTRDVKAAEMSVAAAADVAQNNLLSLNEMTGDLTTIERDVRQVIFTLVEQLEQMKGLLENSVLSIAKQINTLNASTLQGEDAGT